MLRLLAWSALALLNALSAPVFAGEEIARYETRGSFDDVRDNLVSAIEGRGLVINATSQVGDMLERTGRDLGATRHIYGRAVVIEFCTAGVSRRVMEADPQNIVFCPYTIAVYTVPDVRDRVFIAYRRPPADRPAMVEVQQLLEGIVRDALK